MQTYSRSYLFLGAGLILLSFQPLVAQEDIFPDGYNIQVHYDISTDTLHIDETLTISRVISNQESFGLVSLYLSENLPPELEIKSYSLSIDDAAFPAVHPEPVNGGVIEEYDSYYWLIDEPGEDPANRVLMPGEVLRLEYEVTCSVPGEYFLPMHTGVFSGTGYGFFSAGDGITIAFKVDPSCGDVNRDGKIDVLDVVYLVNYRYKDGPPPDAPEMADINYDNQVNILDIIYLINFLYKEGPEPQCQDL